MASTEPSTSLLRPGGRRGPESVPEVPPWETPPRHAHALTALRTVGARQGPGGAWRTLGPGRGSPPPSPGWCRAQAQALGPDSQGRAAAGPPRADSLPLLPPSGKQGRTGRESLTLGHRGGETRCYPRELRTTVPTFVGDSPFRCDCQHRPSRAVEKVTSDPPSSNPPSNPKDRGHRGADPPGRLLWEAKPCR